MFLVLLLPYAFFLNNKIILNYVYFFFQESWLRVVKNKFQTVQCNLPETKKKNAKRASSSSNSSSSDKTSDRDLAGSSSRSTESFETQADEEFTAKVCK